MVRLLEPTEQRTGNAHSTWNVLTTALEESCDRCGCTCTRETTLSAGADVHRVRRRADDHDAPYRIHGREHAHARAHVRGCGVEPIRACVHGCGGAYESENLS